MSVGEHVIETERLALRRLSLDDAELILELLNDTAFIRFIGDKYVRTEADARQYISSGPIASYNQHGFGLWLAELKGQRVSIGICGLLKRETLQDVDLGFALLPRFRSLGYALESAAAVMHYGRKVLALKRIVAVVARDNSASIRVLGKIGMSFERTIRLSEAEPEVDLHVFDALCRHS